MIASLFLSLTLLESIEVDSVTTLGPTLPAPLVDFTVIQGPGAPPPCRVRVLIDYSTSPPTVVAVECRTVMCQKDCDPTGSPSPVPGGWTRGCKCQ